MFGSTSKISFAGAGIAVFAASEANVAWLRKHRSTSTIGPDKLNQLRHVKFFKDIGGLRAHMVKHAEILKPKFDLVDSVLTEALGARAWPRGPSLRAVTLSAWTRFQAARNRWWPWPPRRVSN